MKKVLIVSLFGDPLSNNNSRLNNVYDYIDAECLIITADFDHGRKQYRTGKGGRKAMYLHVPSYKQNLSCKRIYSHLWFAYRLYHYLHVLVEKPDIIYCAMPTSSAAFICGKFCKKYNIRFVIDVVDLWPDSLIPVNKWFRMFRCILYPWKFLTISAYRHANVILGESIRYVTVASQYNKDAMTYPIYLGIDLKKNCELKEKSQIKLEKDPLEIWICYGGSLGNSYDFETLLEAVKDISENCHYKLLFVGGGETQDYIEKRIKELGLNALITGEVSYGDYLKYLSYCDIGINIFKKDTLVVHSYKFNDYVASGLFVLNNLEGETAKIIEDYQIGLNFDYFENPLVEVLRDVCTHWDYYKNFRQNHSRLIDEKLEKEKIYKPILTEILN